MAFSTRSSVVDISAICHKAGIPHIINNAYGVQSSKIMHIVNEAMRLVYLHISIVAAIDG